ncbi:MAG: hypothetical protein ACJA2C_002370 [Marinoscillum sp.]|jgi:hypothetical protein
MLLAQNPSFSQKKEKEAIRVLFVGNSFTYFFNLSQVVTVMAESQGVEMYTRQSTVGGSSLEEHWKQEKGTMTRKWLDSLEWDYVVLNNHSLATIDDPDSFLEYSKKFVELIRSKGAEPVIMQTWGYKSNPLMIKTIIPSYKDLTTQTNTQLVPCGELFAEARKWRPDLELFHDDKHPSSNGTYLLGLAFFKYFTGMSTSEIKFRLWTEDKNGEKLYLIFMDQEDADFLQQLVDDFEFKTLSGE